MGAGHAGRNTRVLSVIDAFTRECLALEVDPGFCQPARDTGAGFGHCPARTATGDSLQQRPGADQLTLSGLGARVKDRAAPHPAGAADAERPCGELPRTSARGVPASKLVHQPVRRTPECCDLADGVQRATSSQQPRLSNSSRVCTRGSNPELWKRCELRPLFHSSGGGIDLQNYLAGLRG